MRSLLLGLAALLALAIPSLAHAQTGGHIKLTYASIENDDEFEFLGENDNTIALSGVVITDVSDRWRIQFNATTADTESRSYYFCYYYEDGLRTIGSACAGRSARDIRHQCRSRRLRRHVPRRRLRLFRPWQQRLAGLVFSGLAALWLARGLVRPIRTLQEGAQRIGAGDLDQQIEVRTGDELESLADQFNDMAARLRESYAGLERKVAERTAEVQRQAHELAEWNRTLELRVAEGVREIEQMGRLKRFLSPLITDLIVGGTTEDPLKSHRREITVVFLDLRGFTASTESADPEEVMGVLQEYHDEMGRIIMAHNGTIEQRRASRLASSRRHR